MTRRRADAVVALLVAVVLVVGGVLGWQAAQRQRALEQMGSMMGTSMGAVHGPSPLSYLVGAVLVAVVVGGGYLVLRDDVTGAAAVDQRESGVSGRPDRGGLEPGAEPSPETGHPGDAVDLESRPRARVLDLLPDDERRVLEPVLESPGITQIELRDRSGFSKSKVSQTVSDLEKRGLLYRERQGRTYRVYPSEDLQQNQR